jgi:hypothetical protein
LLDDQNGDCRFIKRKWEWTGCHDSLRINSILKVRIVQSNVPISCVLIFSPCDFDVIKMKNQP